MPLLLVQQLGAVAPLADSEFRPSKFTSSSAERRYNPRPKVTILRFWGVMTTASRLRPLRILLSVVACGSCLSATAQIFPAPKAYPVGDIPVFLAVGDFNGDRKLDLVVANQCNVEQDRPGNVSVSLGNGDGTFQKALCLAGGPEPAAVAIGDFNNDGKLDFVVVYRGIADIDNEKSVPGTVSIVLGNGDGTFEKPMNFSASIPDSFGDRRRLQWRWQAWRCRGKRRR